MSVNFRGYVFDDSGSAVSGATVQLLETGTTTEEASTTTNSDGLWSFAESDQDKYDIKVTSGASVRYRNWDDQISLKEIDVRNNTGATTPAVTFTNLTNAVSNQVAVFSGANSTKADNDEIYLSFKMADSAGNLDEFARMTVVATDVTTTSEDGQIEFDVIKAGTLTKVWTITSSTGAAMSFDVNVDALTVGSGGDTDVSLTFDANSSDGVITWMEDEDYFKFSDEILMNSTEKLLFGDTGTFIHQSSDGVLTIESDTTVDINGAVAFNGAITGATNITLSGELDAATLDLSSSADIAGDLVLSGGADGALQFTNAGENSIKIPNNQSSALIIEEADNAYITFNTTDSSEAITIAQATTLSSSFTVGVDDTGHDVKFFGASAGAYLIYDQSEDQLEIRGPSADATTSTGKLLLSTALTNINANDVIGKIDFQAPLEAGGTDAITVAASIQAIAQGTFSASVNATDLIFYTGHSEAATEKFRITSQGELGIGGATYGSSGDVLTSGGAGAAPTWATPTTGDVTGVTAGTGLSGGGSSGEVTLNVEASQTQITAVGTIATGVWNGTPVATAYVADNAITLDKLAGIASGKIIYGDASGNPAVLTKATDGDVLTLASGLPSWATPTTGDITSVVAGTGMTGGATSGAATVNVIGGDGITANANDVAITPAQTTITSIYATDIVIGEDAETKIDFETANEIHFDANNAEIAKITASGMEISDSKFIGFASAAGTPNADDTAQGIVIEFLAAEAITQWDAVYVSTTTGRVGRANAAAAGTMPAIGVAIEAQGSAGSSVRVLTHGVYRDGGGFGGNLTIGNEVYAPEADGTLTGTRPSSTGDFIQVMGVAIGARHVFLNPSLTIIEHA